MIYIFTGEDITASRIKLNGQILGKTPIRIEGKKSTAAELEIQLASSGLFDEGKSFVIENFLKFKPQEKLTEFVIKFEKDKTTDIFLWDEADMPIKVKNSLKNAMVFQFTFPKYYYSFLDNLEPQSKRTLELLSQVLKTFEPEQVLYGLIKRIRQLLVLKSDNYQEFSEFAKMQEWQISKLRPQANRWSEQDLKQLFVKLSTLDEKIKTSGLTMPLSAHLDILLMSDLN